MPRFDVDGGRDAKVADDDDLDEFDLDVFRSKRLNPSVFRFCCAVAQDAWQSMVHDTAQALALCSTPGQPNIERFRDQFRITLAFEPAQMRDALLLQYRTGATTLRQIRETREDLIALVDTKVVDKSHTSYTPGEVVAALVGGAPPPGWAKTVIIHVADDLRGRSGTSDPR